MNRFKAAALCLFLAAGCGGNSGADGQGNVANDVTFISGALLIPGDGNSPIEEATMIIENGVIKEVGMKGEFYAPKGSLPVDLEGRTIMPLMVNLNGYPGLGGLSEFGAKNYKRESVIADLSRYGYYGVGAVLAGGDSDGLAFQIRDERNATTIARLYTSGRGIAARGNSGVMGDIPLLVGSADDARKAVGELADRNVAAITLWASGMRNDAAAAVVDEAHKRNLKVFADAPTLAEAKNLVNANVDALISSIRDREVDNDIIAMMKAKNIPLAPALSSLEAHFVYIEKPSWLGEQAMREVYPPGLSAYLSDTVVVNRFRRDPQLNAYRQQFATANSNLKKLSDNGVPIAFGSGSGLSDTFPGYFEHREMELMVDAGLTPMQVITAATSVSANALGIDDLGALARGKSGSFIVFANNPLDKITNSKGIEVVYLGGSNLDRLEMIRTIQVETPRITQAERNEEAAIQRAEDEAAREARMPHYGKFVLSDSPVRVAPGLSLQTPKRSRATGPSGGPPYRVTVTLANASGADLRGFYAAVFKSGWSTAGDCWERPNPIESGKKFRVCTEPSANQIVLNISVQ